MKKLLVFLFAICTSITINAQIQTKFWGLELSKYYPSLSQATEIVSQKCKYARIEDDSIYAIGGSFGGYYWDSVRFHFCNGYYSKALDNVIFFSDHSSQSSAREQYNSLFRALCKKYSAPEKLSDSYDDISHRWRKEGSKYSCMIRLLKIESTYGNTSWCVCLSYLDHHLAESVIAQEENEL